MAGARTKLKVMFSEERGFYDLHMPFDRDQTAVALSRADMCYLMEILTAKCPPSANPGWFGPATHLP